MTEKKPQKVKGKSPYAKYQKKEFDYSGMYRRLIEAHRNPKNPLDSPLAAHMISRGRG